MRKELRRSLFAAAFGSVTLAGCFGGNSSSSSTSSGVPAPAPSPTPPPIPTSAGSYYLIGLAGFFTNPQQQIPFAPSAPAGASPFGLIFADSTNPPTAFSVTTAAANQVAAGGTPYDLGSVSEYFPNGAGSATGWGTRYRLYAKANTGATDASLYAVDLRKSGTTPATLASAQISSGTVVSLRLCGSPRPVVFDNYRSANLSWVVFHEVPPPGGDNNCGTLDDNFVALQLSMSSSTAPKMLNQLEPIEALYDSNGTITGFLAINHPAVSNGAITAPVSLQKLDANVSNATTFSRTLTGTGLNIAGVPSGDFLSLGISSSGVWLYVDSSNIYAIDLSSGTTTQISGFTLGTGDNIQSRAVFDGTTAYVGVNNNTAGGYVVQIDTSGKTVVATQARDTAALANMTLVGVTSNNVVYLLNDGSAIKSIAKSGLTALASLKTLTTGQKIDGPMLAGGTSGSPTAYLVGDTLYFTVADSSGATGYFAKQAFYTTFSGSTPTTTAIASVSAVLGAVQPTSVPTTGPISNEGVLAVTGGANGVTAGQPVFASSTVAATIGLYGTAGTLLNPVGQFSMSNPAAGTRVNPIYGVALDSGPVQAGMPAMLELFGTDGTGANASDIAIYASDASTTFAQLSGFAQ
jgi:hypothetical protein